MKFALYILLTFAMAMTVIAQAKPTTAADYEGTLQYAVRETNAAFPFIFTVVTKRYELGKLVSTQTDIAERQAQGIERETTLLKKGQKTLYSYSIQVGFDNQTYCSSDGKVWKGPQQYVCPGPTGSNLTMLYGARDPMKIEYSVMEKDLNGKPVKVYRKYAVYLAQSDKDKYEYEEEIATIDDRGFFISVVNTEGTLAPKTITLTRSQTWDFATKFKPVVAPK
ncbi:MAG: hypothetical protein JNL64_14210 [Blastocatellia bacterium]|nr:hypothetical protein [Blastocatellia bacterium]